MIFRFFKQDTVDSLMRIDLNNKLRLFVANYCGAYPPRRRINKPLHNNLLDNLAIAKLGYKCVINKPSTDIFDKENNARLLEEFLASSPTNSTGGAE